MGIEETFTREEIIKAAAKVKKNRYSTAHELIYSNCVTYFLDSELKISHEEIDNKAYDSIDQLEFDFYKK